MKFDLRWKKIARDELAQIWLDADSETRKQISRSCHLLEVDLRKNPLQVGESRPGNRRIGFESPLGIIFRVSEEQRMVKVLHVWKT